MSEDPRTKAEWLRAQFHPNEPTFPLDAELRSRIPRDLSGRVPRTQWELYALDAPDWRPTEGTTSGKLGTDSPARPTDAAGSSHGFPGRGFYQPERRPEPPHQEDWFEAGGQVLFDLTVRLPCFLWKALSATVRSGSRRKGRG
jgi:hypothetical protein